MRFAKDELAEVAADVEFSDLDEDENEAASE
jgi:hypothetical protein